MIPEINAVVLWMKLMVEVLDESKKLITIIQQ